MKSNTSYIKYQISNKQHHLYNLDKLIDEAQQLWKQKQNKRNKNINKNEYQRNMKDIHKNTDRNMNNKYQQNMERNISQTDNIQNNKTNMEDVEEISGDETESTDSDSDGEYYTDKIDISIENIEWRQILNKKEIQQQQKRDPIFGPIIKCLTTENEYDIKILPKYVRKQYRKNMFMYQNDLLRLRNDKKQILIPPNMRTDIIKYFHTNFSGLHQSAKRIYKVMKQYVYWFGMFKDIKLYIQYCKICKMAKKNANKKEGYLQLFTPSKPFEMVCIDIVGPLPVTRRGNRYILTTIDKFTRFVHMIPVQTITAENIAYEFRAEYLLKYGIPDKILSDRGSQFTGYIFKILCKLYGVDKIFTTAYHPETNGMIERFHRYLKERLRVIAAEYDLDFIKYDDWDIYLPEIEFSYNNTPNEMTKKAPYEVIYGHLLNTPIQHILNKDIQTVVEETVDTMNIDSTDTDILKLPQKVQNYIDDLKERTKIILSEMKHNMDKYDKYRKEYYDKNRVKPTVYKNLERVFVDTSDKVKGNKRKLNINRKEATIIDILNDNAYIVQYDDGTRESVNIKRIYKNIDNNNENIARNNK